MGKFVMGVGVFFRSTYKLTELKDSECEQARKQLREGCQSNYSTARPSRPIGNSSLMYVTLNKLTPMVPPSRRENNTA